MSTSLEELHFRNGALGFVREPIEPWLGEKCNGVSLQEAMKPLPFDVDGKTAKYLEALERGIDLSRMERTRPRRGRS